jgi:hypothetical protein
MQRLQILVMADGQTENILSLIETLHLLEGLIEHLVQWVHVDHVLLDLPVIAEHFDPLE